MYDYGASTTHFKNMVLKSIWFYGSCVTAMHIFHFQILKPYAISPLAYNLIRMLQSYQTYKTENHHSYLVSVCNI